MAPTEAAVVHPGVISRETRPERDQAARAFPLGEDLLLYLPKEHVVLALNGSARAVWEACDGRRSIGEIAAGLADRLGNDPDQVAADVACTVEALASRGLLREMQEAAKPALDDTLLLIAFGGYTVAVDSGLEAVRSGIGHRFQHLLAKQGEPATKVSTQQLDDGSVRILRGGRSRRREAKPTTVERSVEGEIIQAFLGIRSDLLWFHAGAAALGGTGILVVGAAGSGKSTIVTALVGRGADYLSDEIVAFDPIRRTLLAFPLAPRVRVAQDRRLTNDEVQRLARFEVGIETERVAREPLPVGAVLFPEFDPDGAELLESCRPAAAAARLLASCQEFARQPELAIRAVVELVASVPSFTLRFRHGSRAAGLIESDLLVGSSAAAGLASSSPSPR